MIQEKSLQNLEWNRVLDELKKRTHSPLGRELCQELPLLSERLHVQQRLAETTEAVALLQEDVSLPLDEVEDIRPLVEKARHQGILEGKGYRAVGKTLVAGAQMKQVLEDREERFPRLFLLASSLKDLSRFGKTLLDFFDEEGALADSASAYLKTLRKQSKKLGLRIKQELESLIHSSKYGDILQDDYFTLREGRYVVPVRVDAEMKLPGIVHGYSQSRATIFIEPEWVTQLNNELRMVEIEIEKEVQHILRQLSEEIGRAAPVIQGMLSVLGEIDFALAKARLSRDIGGCEPRLNTSGRIALKEVRHPLLALTEGRAVSNDFVVAPDIILTILTGPNTGGKTVMIKTIGLCAAMVRAGLHVPAADPSEIPIFDPILADIGDEQDITKNLSTFSAHIQNVRDMLQQAGSQSLLLFDELAGSTDPAEGEALALAITEVLLKEKITSLVSTHYGRMKIIGNDHPHTQNYSLEFNIESVSPTYRLQAGIPGQSYASEIASRIGLDAPIIARAQELMGEAQFEINHLLSDLNTKKQELEALQQRLAKSIQSHQEERSQLKAKLREMEGREEDFLNRERKQLAEELQLARSKIAGIIRQLQADGSPKTIQRSRERLKEIQQRFAGELARLTVPPPELVLDPGKLRVGQQAFVSPLGEEGEILSLPDRKGHVKIRVGETVVDIHHNVLTKASGITKKKRKTQGRKRTVEDYLPQPPPATPSRSCDLRGNTADEALETVEKFLDTALLEKYPEIYLIHGSGKSDRLKNTVRAYLKNSPYVAKFQSAERNQGGDGTTVVTLNL